MQLFESDIVAEILYVVFLSIALWTRANTVHPTMARGD